MTEREVRRNSGKLAELCDGRGRILFHESGAKVLTGVDSVGVKALDLAIFADSGNEVTLLPIDKAKAIVDVGIVGPECKSFLVLCNCAVEVLHLGEKISQVRVGAQKVRLAANCLLDFRFCGIEIAKALQ